MKKDKIKTMSDQINAPKRKIVAFIGVAIVLILVFKFIQWRSETIEKEQKEQLVAAKQKVDVTDEAIISLDKQAAIEGKIFEVKTDNEILAEKVIELEILNKARASELELLMQKMDILINELHTTKSENQKERQNRETEIMLLEKKISNLSEEQNKIKLPPLPIIQAHENNKNEEKKKQELPLPVKEETKKTEKPKEPKQEKEVVAFSFFSSSTSEEETKILNMNSMEDTNTTKPEAKKPIPYVIRMGFVDAVSMTGVSVPVQGGTATAPSDTYPIFFKIGDRSLGSNNHTQDLRNCLAMGAARGNGNSNRVMTHIIKISCTDPSGTKRYEATVEKNGVNGYVYGDDNILGMAGVKENLSGEMVGKSMIAGFLQGVANAFNEIPAMVGITGEVTKPGERGFTEGFASGSSQSLGVIADYYIDLAKTLLPVISVKAGRKVTIGFGSDIEFEAVDFKTVFVNTPFEYEVDDATLQSFKTPTLKLN
jgi:conjugal transfer pilus assembly protein TraB